MKRNTMIFAALLVIAAGCSKDKKEETTPEVTEQAPEPEPAPVAEVTEPEVEETGPSAELEELILFEFDSSALDDGARSKLEQNADWLKEDEARTLTIEGHTDEKGTTEYNVALGDRRARAAKDYLVRLGIDESRIKIISYGEERPASSNDAANRRGVFVGTRR